MLLVLVELDIIGKVHDGTVDPDPGEAVLPEFVYLLAVLSFSAPDDGGKDGEALHLAEGEDGVDDLGSVLALDLLAAPVAKNMADAGKEEPEIIVYLCDGTHGASRVLADALLLDADRRRQSLDIINIGFFHQFEELPGIGGKGLHVPALAFGIDRVEGEGRLAGTAGSRDDDHLVAGNGYVDALEVMLSRTFYEYTVHFCL